MERVFEYDGSLHVEEDGGAYAVFPWDIRQLFGGGRVRVRAEFDGQPYRGSIVHMGLKTAAGDSCYVIGVRKDIRARTGKGDGQSIHVRIEVGEGAG